MMGCDWPLIMAPSDRRPVDPLLANSAVGRAVFDREVITFEDISPSQEQGS